MKVYRDSLSARNEEMPHLPTTGRWLFIVLLFILHHPYTMLSSLLEETTPFYFQDLAKQSTLYQLN